jgi:hypothetical protein
MLFGIYMHIKNSFSFIHLLRMKKKWSTLKTQELQMFLVKTTEIDFGQDTDFE